MDNDESGPGARALALESSPMFLDDLTVARGRFTAARVDCLSPCTASEDQSCHIVQQLTAWNEFLSAAQLELREVIDVPGQLSLTSFRDPWLAAPSKDEMDHAVAAVYCLLKRHHCVISFTVSEGTLKRHETLLFQALNNNAHLKKLKIHFSTADAHKKLCGVIASLSSLELLVCETHRTCPPQFLSVLTTQLRTTTSLTGLRMPNLFMGEESARQFLEALQENRTLTEIHVHDSALSAPGLDKLCTDYFGNTRVLTTLTVEASYERSCECLKLILRGLLVNRSITRMTMAYCELDVISAELVQRVFEENAVLRAFILAPLQRPIDPSLQRAYDRWLDALLQNETLQEVCLSVSAWKPDQWKVFFDRLSLKKNLKVVTIGTRYNERRLLPRVCFMLRESGATHKVYFGSYQIKDSLHFLKSRGFINFQVYPTVQENVMFVQIFDLLSTFGRITTVHLAVWPGNIDTGTAEAFGRFIENTTTLRRLFLTSQREHTNLKTIYACWETVVRSLTRNRSLRELYVDRARLDHEGTRTLARVIASSRFMRKAHYIPRWLCDAHEFIQTLRESLADNYSLLDLTVEWCMNQPMSKDWLAVAEVPRRNASLVARAAYFASGSRFDRDSAESLEQVWRSPALLEELVETSGESKEATMDYIRERLRTLESMDIFMRLAGVVKERVTCVPRPHGDSRPQLCDLNEYCWRRVRGYLTLQDVRAETPPVPPDA